MPRASSRSSSSAWASCSRASARSWRARVGVGLEAALDHAQLQRERHEPLLGAVVQVALQPPALGVAGLDDAGARARELVVGVGVGERLRHELGEVAAAGAPSPPPGPRTAWPGHQHAPQPAADGQRSRHGRRGSRASADARRARRARPRSRRCAPARRCGGPGHDRVPFEVERRAERQARQPGSRQLPTTVALPVGLVAQRRSRSARQQARDLRGDLLEHGAGRGLAGHERRDAPQRRLLGREGAASPPRWPPGAARPRATG